MSLRGCHLLLGAIGLVLFVLTGQYMARVIGVPELSDAQRMLYRSNHIYLLLACGMNVFVGCAMVPGDKRGRLQQLCSAILVVATLLLAWSFFFEPATGSLARPVTGAALYLLFIAPVVLLSGELVNRLR